MVAYTPIRIGYFSVQPIYNLGYWYLLDILLNLNMNIHCDCGILLTYTVRLL